MSSKGGAIRAGKAYYELGGDTSLLTKALQSAEKLVKGSVAAINGKLKGTLSSIGATIKQTLTSPITALAAAIAPLAAAHLFAGMGEELTDIARRTGASTDALQTLGYAAKRTGQDLGAIEGTMTTLRDKIMDAARGSDEAQLAFARLGLNFLKLSRLKPEDQLRKVAAALNAIPNPAIRAAMATNLLGSADMLPTLAAMNELETRAKRLGLVLGEDTVAGGKRLSNALKDLHDNLLATAATIGARIAPAISELIERWVEMSGATRQWISDNTLCFASADALWAFLKLKWAEGADFLNRTWRDVQGKMVEVASDLINSIPAAWEVVKATAASAAAFVDAHWVEATTAIRTAWINATAGIQADWITATHVIESALDNLGKAFDFIGRELMRPFEEAATALEILGFKMDDIQAKLKNFGKGHGVIIGANLREFAGLNDPQLDLKLAKNDQKRRNKLADLQPAKAPEIEKKLDAFDAPVKKAVDALNDLLKPLINKLDQPPADNPDLKALADDFQRKLNEALANVKNAAPGGAGSKNADQSKHANEGVAQALVNVKGIGAQDIRSKEGFASAAASLRQQSIAQDTLYYTRRTTLALEALGVLQ